MVRRGKERSSDQSDGYAEGLATRGVTGGGHEQDSQRSQDQGTPTSTSRSLSPESETYQQAAAYQSVPASSAHTPASPGFLQANTGSYDAGQAPYPQALSTDPGPSLETIAGPSNEPIDDALEMYRAAAQGSDGSITGRQVARPSTWTEHMRQRVRNIRRSLEQRRQSPRYPPPPGLFDDQVEDGDDPPSNPVRRRSLLEIMGQVLPDAITRNSTTFFLSRIETLMTKASEAVSNDKDRISAERMRATENSPITSIRTFEPAMGDNVSDFVFSGQPPGTCPRTSSAVILYKAQPSLSGSNVWPDCRDLSKAPLQCIFLNDLRSRQQHRQQPQQHEGSTDQVRGPTRAVCWPANRMPSELYTHVASHLSRDDIKAMRLTCKEFEKYISHALFSDVVVPFNTEIYGMLEGNEKRLGPLAGVSSPIVPDLSKFWGNSAHNAVYAGHGLHVFSIFGPHVRRYGMVFEVDEAFLAQPPGKSSMERQDSYWGSFQWPHLQYKRFERTERLENTADETPKMKQAFSHLTQVRELALSIDSGLGWLSGPDKSIRSQIFDAAVPVFGSPQLSPDRLTLARERLWWFLKRHHAQRPEIDLRSATLRRIDFAFQDSDFEDALKAWQSRNSMQNLWLEPRIVKDLEVKTQLSKSSKESGSDRPVASTTTLAAQESQGLLYTVDDDYYVPSDRNRIIPNALTYLQKMWLLETEWAQRAFFSSYMIAIIDNPTTFTQVHTLKLARISSRYLTQFNRVDFWAALPSVRNVTIKVIADWRETTKDPLCFVDTSMIAPSNALLDFHLLLRNTVSKLEHVKNLTIGWASGGEHAEGVHARNKHLLPAPFLLPGFLEERASRRAPRDALVVFPHVEHLTVQNGWVPPGRLVALVEAHSQEQLQKLSLVSVSLTAMERAHDVPPPPQHAQDQLLGSIGEHNDGIRTLVYRNDVRAAEFRTCEMVPATGSFTTASALVNQLAHEQYQSREPLLFHIPLLVHPPNEVARTILSEWKDAMDPRSAARFKADWRVEPRRGSWPAILDEISPGKNLADFQLPHSIADPAAAAASHLTELELVSCGYAKITSSRFENHVVEPPISWIITDKHFRRRREVLAPSMMTDSNDAYLGQLTQHIPPNEMATLEMVWGCTFGWTEEYGAWEGPTFDGAWPGGTGRFSGVLRKSDRAELDMPAE